MPTWLSVIIAKVITNLSKEGLVALGAYLQDLAVKAKRLITQSKAEKALQEKTDAKAPREEKQKSEQDFLNS